MVRLLEPDDAGEYIRLRRASLDDAPLAFASSPEDDRFTTEEAVHASVIFGAFEPDLVGAAGLYRDRHVKFAHKAHLWGMYVSPAHRGRGIGQALLDAVLAHARTLEGVAWVHLSVSEAAPEARRLYERAGFTLWGSEPEALRHGNRTVVEHYMALRLGS